MNLTFEQTKLYALETPLPIGEGSSITFGCTFWGDVSSTSAKVYRADTLEDVTSTIMPSGSVSESDNTATLKQATAWTGGFQYILEVTTTIGGDVYVKKLIINVNRAGQ